MKKKLLLTISILVCAVALIIGSVAGTIAYLRVFVSVTNTFTFGKVAISMTETLVNDDGTPVTDNTNRGYANRYLLMPGKSYIKDPIIHVGEESQAMFLFLKVDNGISGLALTQEDLDKLAQDNAGDPEYEVPKTIHEQLLSNGWKVYATDDTSPVEYKNTIHTNAHGANLTSTSTVYYLSVGADPSEVEPKVVCGNKITPTAGVEKAVDIATFNIFTVSPSNATEDTMTAYVNNNASVVVTAFAIQSSGEGIQDYHDAAEVFNNEFASAIPTVNP